MESKTVEKDSCPVELTAKEYDLFLLFLRIRNIALYRERIYEEVWGGEFHPDRLKREKAWADWFNDTEAAPYPAGDRCRL